MPLVFKHKGLEKFAASGSSAGINAEHKAKLIRMLALLRAAKSPRAMDLPGYKLHPLKGDRAGAFAVTVSGNWRLVFEFRDDGDITIDYEDYH